jgi:hypothetical protein
MNCKRCFLVLVSLLMTGLVPSVRAQIPAEVRQAVDRILQDPPRVYQLNARARDSLFEKMDKFYDQHFGVLSAKEIRKGKLGYVKTQSQLTPDVMLQADGVRKLASVDRSEMTVTYERGTGKRGFQLNVRRPTKDVLSDAQAFDLARLFVMENGFWRSTRLDSMIPAQVLTRRLARGIQDSASENLFTLYHRVVMKRHVNSLEVLNSHQMVDIYPTTRDIIGYRSSDWTPVDDKAARPYQYISGSEVAAHIDSVLRMSEQRNSIQRVGTAYMEMGGLLVPVITVEHKSASSRPDDIGAEPTRLLVIMVKDLPLPQTPMKTRMPEKAK